MSTPTHCPEPKPFFKLGLEVFKFWAATPDLNFDGSSMGTAKSLLKPELFKLGGGGRANFFYTSIAIENDFVKI